MAWSFRNMLWPPPSIDTTPQSPAESTSPSQPHTPRRGAASDRGKDVKNGNSSRSAKAAALKRVLDVTPLPGGAIDTDSNGDPQVRRISSRRHQPAQFIFPTAYDHEMVSTKSAKGGLRRGATFVRSGSLAEAVGGDHLEQLHLVFEICDGDDDGDVNEKELVMLLMLIGMKEPDAMATVEQKQKHGAGFKADAADRFPGLRRRHGSTIDYESFLKTFRLEIIAFHTPPRKEFLVRCKRLKGGFKKCDGDGDSLLSKSELEIAMQKLDLSLSDGDLDRIFMILDRDQDGSIDWSDFVYCVWRNTLACVTATMREYFAIDLFTELPTLIRPLGQPPVAILAVSPVAASSPLHSPNARSLPDVGVDASNHGNRFSFSRDRVSFAAVTDRLASSKFSPPAPSGQDTKSAIERMGVQYLTRFSMVQLSQAKHASSVVAPRPASFHRRTSIRSGFAAPVRRQIRVIEATAVGVGALAGILCGLLSVWFENMVNNRVDDRTTWYYVLIILINIFVSIIEVHGMYATAMVCAFRMTVCTRLKLYPQDAEREFLTRSIARAALQVGHRKAKLFGIDPMKGSPRIVLFMTFLMYKSKRYMLKFLLKLFIKRVVWRAAAKSVLSLLVLPINGLMNAWTLRGVMIMCRVSIIGPPCATSLLEMFFDQEDALLPFQRVDCVRVLGCALVCKRSIHPNLEIMLEHMRHQWLKPHLWPVTDGCQCLDMGDDTCPRHALDDSDLLMGSLTLYASQLTGPAGGTVRQHMRNMYFLLIVALIIDGDVDWVERRFYIRACQAGRVRNAWTGVLRLKDDFIAGKGINRETILTLIQEIQEDAQTTTNLQGVPWRESLMYSAHRVSKLLSW